MKTTGYNSITSWIAVVGCFIVRFLVTLPMRLAGLFFVIILTQYDTDRTTATYPFIIFGVLRTLTGPFVGYVGEIFGLRGTTIIGCTLAALGIGVCFFLYDITAVILSFGLIYGMGLGLGSTLLPAILKQHFNKDHNFVNGIVLTGSCVGAFVMPPVIQYLIHKYGVFGMFLILSAIVLNSIPASMLLMDPKNKEQSQSLSHTCDDPENRAPVIVTASSNLKTAKEESADTSFLSHISETNISTNDKFYENEAFENGNESTDSELREAVSNIIERKKFHNLNEKKEEKVISTSNEVKLIKFSSLKNMENKMLTTIHENMECGTENMKSVEHNNQMQNSDNSHTASVQKRPSFANEKENKEILTNSLKLFKDPTFILIMMTQSIHVLNTSLNWTILLDYANDKGINPNISLQFVMFLPVSETVGNLSLNWIADRGFMTRTNFSTACYLILTLDSLYMAWTNSFATMMIGVFIYGFLCGAISTTFPGVVLDHIDEDQQNMALASHLVPYAFLCLSKAPLIGYFRTGLGSYDWIYFIIAVLSFINGISTFFIPALSKCRGRKQERNRHEIRN